MRHGFSIGHIAGIDIQIDWSLVIIFALITFSLGMGLFPVWHPDWSGALVWLTALMAAVLFFVSVLLHELAHAVVGRQFGARIPRITLFVFGGMSHLEREPSTAKAEFWMAIVGPIASLAIGFACLFLGSAMADFTEADMEDPQQLLSSLNPVSTLLLWLGPVNIILGLFNLVPGYPLDGGRVLRAALWRITGDQYKATQWAARGGQAFAWLLMVTGLAVMLGYRIPIIGGGFINGLWLAFIGWFLNTAAIMSYQQLVVRRSLGETPVTKLMHTGLLTIPPDMKLAHLVDDYLLQSNQRAFPVVTQDDLVGLVSLEDVRAMSSNERAGSQVADIMTPRAKLITVDAAADSADALAKLTQNNINQLPVLEQGKLVGMITRENVLRWLSLEDRL